MVPTVPVADNTINIAVMGSDRRPDWNEWKPTAPETVVKPELPFEGVALPNEPSILGWAPQPVHQTRDPAVYREGDRTWLIYSVAGEDGLAITEWKE